MKKLSALLLFLGLLGLSACSQPIDPDRPPLKDYEPPPIGSWPDQQGRGLPSRV